MLSCRAPQRQHSLRWHSHTLKVYRATSEAVKATWRRDGIDIEAMEGAAEEALERLRYLQDNPPIETP